MVRFSCFHSHIPSQKTKKQAQPPSEPMVNNQFSSFNDLGSSHQSPSREKRDCDSKNDVQSSQNPFLVGGGSKLGEMNTDTKNTRVSPVRQFRRSLSLGCNLNEEGRIYEENNSDDHTGLAFSRDGSHYQLNHATAMDPKSPPTTIVDHEYASVEPLNFSCNELNNESVFSVGDQQYPEKEGADNYNNQVDAEVAIDSGIQTPRSLSMISKSHSLPNLPSMLSRSARCSPSTFSAYRSRSSEDLNVLSMMRKETRVHNVSIRHSTGCNEDYYLFKSDKNAGQNGVPDGCDDSYSCAASNKDWIVPILDDEMHAVQNFQGESSSHQLDQLPNKDFKFKRIENWVIDLQECSPVEENQEMDDMNEIYGPLDQGIAVSAAKEEANLNPSIQAAKKYISSLSASATAAQLTNHGLVVVPFLSAFVTLKVVNLSGNSIVRITAGALPRGLHMLNLSKNKICTIEGLRELTRLRILDLSYNRITRIGHGLASCSSLKELYIAGNKISEVEGLHRLLKLAVLDLRFNKISTSKGFGQLAANYNSLQAISIEGNPAQKNVGDEQLKKHLQGLLPHLAYYNRQGIKSNSLKDSSERSVRLGMAAHQFDRGHKSDHKSIRRLTHGSTTLRQPSVKGQGVETPKRSRSKQVPPGGTRTPHHRHHHQVPLELNMKPLVVPDFAMKKSYSMGALNAL